MKNDKIITIKKKIEALKTEIKKLGPMRPGALRKHQQKKDGEVYGEYWHISYTHKGQGHTNYVPKKRLAEIRMEIQNYEKFRKIVDKLISLSIELSKFKTKNGSSQ